MSFPGKLESKLMLRVISALSYTGRGLTVIFYWFIFEGQIARLKPFAIGIDLNLAMKEFCLRKIRRCLAVLALFRYHSLLSKWFWRLRRKTLGLAHSDTSNIGGKWLSCFTASDAWCRTPTQCPKCAYIKMLLKRTNSTFSKEISQIAE